MDTPAPPDLIRLRAALGGVGRFTAADILSAQFSRLTGLTNRVYKAAIGTEALCIRLPGAGTAAFIDRAAEANNAAAAARSGVAPPLLWTDDDGVMVTPFLPDAAALSAQAFRLDGRTVERSATALRRLHCSTEPFMGELRPFAVIRTYAEALQRQGGCLPEDAGPLLAATEAIRSALEQRPAQLRPCHCDPTGPNLLDTGARLWIVDWEYSGMCDPMWDLAYLAVENGFDRNQVARLLTAYFGREPTPPETGRLVLLRPLTRVIAGLWALLQANGGNHATDFGAYALERLRCAADLINSPDFARHMEAVARG